MPVKNPDMLSLGEQDATAIIYINFLGTPNEIAIMHTFYQFLQALPHDMNVMDVVEFYGNIAVMISALISLPSSLVSHGINLETKESISVHATAVYLLGRADF